MAAPDESGPQYRIRDHRCMCQAAPKVPLFEWVGQLDDGPHEEGDEPPSVVYSVPEHFEAHVGLDYLELVATQGEDLANRWALIQALGVDGWNALRSPGMDTEVFDFVMGNVLRRVRGSLRRGPKARLSSV